MEILHFNDSNLTNEEWDNFVKKSDNGTIFHERKFLSYHPEGRFSDNCAVINKKGKLFSVLPATIRERDGKRVLISHGGSSYGGFIHKSDLNLKDAFELVNAFEKFGKDNKCDAVQITPPPMIYLSKYSNYLDFALFRNGFEYLKREVSSVVQLDTPKDKILSTFRPEARTAVNKSIKQGIEIVETERFDQYYEILKKNLKMRHGVTPTHSLEELLKLKLMYPGKIRLFGAFLGEKLIAGVCNFSANDKVVLAFYISHDEEYQEYRPVNLLFYEIMKRYQEEGFKFLDFGIFTVNMEPNWGLGRFKENFGARGIFRDTYYKEIK